MSFQTTNWLTFSIYLSSYGAFATKINSQNNSRLSTLQDTLRVFFIQKYTNADEATDDLITFYISILYKQLSLYSVDGTQNTARLGKFISDNQTKYNLFLAIYLKVYNNILPNNLFHSSFKFLDYLSIIYFYLMFISLSPFFAFINQNTKKKYSM